MLILLTVHLSIGMGCFHFLVIASNAAMNMCVQTPDEIPAVILIGICPETEVLGTSSAWHLTFLLSRLSFGVPHQFAFLYLRDVKVTHQACLLLCFIDKHATVSLQRGEMGTFSSLAQSLCTVPLGWLPWPIHLPSHGPSKTLRTRNHAVAPVIWDGCTLAASHQK